MRRPACALAVALILPQLLAGCAVVAVTATAVSVTATAVGLAADAAVGTAKVVGKGVAKGVDMAVDAMSNDETAADNSGIQIRESIRPAPGAPSAPPALPGPLPPTNPPSAHSPV